MSKKSQKFIECGKRSNRLNKEKIDEKCILKITLNSDNFTQWNTLKGAFSCSSNEEFVSCLLTIAQNHLNDKTRNDTENSQKENRKGQTQKSVKHKKALHIKKNKNEIKTFNLNLKSQFPEISSTSSSVSKCQQLANDVHSKGVEETAKKITDFQDGTEVIKFNSSTNLVHKTTASKKLLCNQVCDTDIREKIESTSSDINISNKARKSKLAIALDKNISTKSPTDEKETKVIIKQPESEFVKKRHESNDHLINDNKSPDRCNSNGKICTTCNTKHIQDRCPVFYQSYFIIDSLTLLDWETKYKPLYENSDEKVSNSDTEQEVSEEDKNRYSFANLSLPDVFYLKNMDTTHGTTVLCKSTIQPFTQFGPLIGKIIKEVDISEDSSMRDIWEIVEGSENIYVSTEDLADSNWMRYVRPAPTREDRNVVAIKKKRSMYFINIKPLKTGEELLYWQDSETPSKKKMEKTSCGGCNMVFAHPLYYRTHCSVFHDLRYSLTIRKYHCKVCGAAVLGKENIMKHATELHNGQGAYQCQFCKKFFLRLNYLEMHRTYGCSSNPHRARPLCDFCGKKFCQPQKLKVHIKRMHSDFSEVLKEFQCKKCKKILGSRAALQRHCKEVHEKQTDTSCSCIRCGKKFQNKSNLKIHMLTHSGIKPFRCSMSNCTAGFTTKQCLQFHYKKVHNLSEEIMPKIERSVNYTFEAYSGFGHRHNRGNEESNLQNGTTALDDDGSDFDDVNSLDSKTLDDPPPLQSPVQSANDHSPEPSPPPMDTFSINSITTGMKVVSKGSKKWIGDQPPLPSNQTIKTEMYQMDHTRLMKEDLSNITLQVQEAHIYDRTKLNTNLNAFGRHESSNASLLVEAALDSVCSEPNIDIDVGSAPNCTDSLVNNLYTLAPNDSLPDVSYSESVCMNESRNINLISPSVNDHISVTDELNDELQQNQNIGMGYTTFHQEDFSPTNSPGIHQRNAFVRNYINSLSPQDAADYDQGKNLSPVPSPPRYDFGHAVNTDHLSSDDSNGMGAQNLSLHDAKTDIQLDLSIYKSPYKLEPPGIRKDFRLKLDNDSERNYENDPQMESSQISNMNQSDFGDKNLNPTSSIDMNKEKEDESERTKYPEELSNDLRHKFDLDLDLRMKNYDPGDIDVLRPRNVYENANDLDFRSKNYDLIDSVENRNKTYENTVDSDFRIERNFEPLILNSELQGLDMSARSFHNYPNINRYHHLYPDVDRVDLRLNYSPPPPSYTHADILRVVSLDLTPPGRHSVDLSLRTHPLHQIANTRLLSDHGIQTNRLIDQTRLLSSDLTTARHLSNDARLLNESTGRLLSDHTTNRILSTNDQLSSSHLLSSEQPRLLSDDSRLLSDQPRLLEQNRLIGDGRILPPTTPSGSVSPVPTFSGYSVSQAAYHPTGLAPPRSHVTSPTPSPYHHYTPYY